MCSLYLLHLCLHNVGELESKLYKATYVHAGGGTLIGGGIIPVRGGGTLTGCPGGGGGAIIGTGKGIPPAGGASANNWCGRSA